MVENFGWNGVPLERVSEPVAERESAKFRDSEIAIPCLLAILSSFGVTIFLGSFVDDPDARVFAWYLLAAISFAFIFSSVCGFVSQAQDQERLPSTSNAVQHPKHVSGLGAGIIVAIVLCLACAAYFGHTSDGHIRIPEWLGFAVVLGLSALFAWIFLISRMFDVASLRGAQRVLERAFSPLVPLGRIFSWVDALLVFAVAPTFGATLSSTTVRYSVLFGHLCAGTFFAWAAPSPIGLAGTLWPLLGIVAVSRRWSWIETERNKLLLDPELPASELRIGVDSDLRDEAILGLLLLMVVLPVGMRQVHLSLPSVQVFAAEGAVVDQLDAWIGFFGVELLKALPFLDWADVYDAQAATRIETSGPLSMHVVLFARALIDLLFISALFQSISISVSLAKNRSDFLNRRASVDKLDQRIETRELTSLAYKSGEVWKFRSDIDRYSHYNLRRLSRLRLSAPKGSRLRLVVDRILEISNRKVIPPSEQLVNVTAAKKVDPKLINAAIDEVRDAKDFDLEFLSIARRQLNRRGGLEAERLAVVQFIVSNIAASPEREEELAQILYGPDADSLANIRMMAMYPLARNARSNSRNSVVLTKALLFDRSRAVRARVQAEMKRLSITPVNFEDEISQQKSA